METKKIEAETALRMTEPEMLDIVFEASENQKIEIFAADPYSHNDGVYLEVVKLDDYESVVRDRWPNQDGTRHIVSTKGIAAIYRALVDQVYEGVA